MTTRDSSARLAQPPDIIAGFAGGKLVRDTNEGVRRVCAYQRRLVESENAANGHAEARAHKANVLTTPMEPISPGTLAQLGL